MKNVLLVFMSLLVFGAQPTVAQTSNPAATTEVLVLTTATELPRLSGRAGIEIQNNGPNAIHCAFSSAAAVVGTARSIAASGGTWALGASSRTRIWCVAATAAQVTGAATVVSEFVR